MNIHIYTYIYILPITYCLLLIAYHILPIAYAFTCLAGAAFSYLLGTPSTVSAPGGDPARG